MLSASRANAVQEIGRCGGTQFDPEVVRAFLDIGEDGLMKIKADMVARKAEIQKRNEELLRQKKEPKPNEPTDEKAATPPAVAP